MSNFIYNSNDFTLTDKELGQGIFGAVRTAICKENGSEYAVKLLKVEDNTDDDEQIHLIFAASTYSALNHPSIVTIYGINFRSIIDLHKYQPTILIQYIQNGSLKQIYEKVKKNDIPGYWNTTTKYICILGISIAMLYLHNNEIMHLDLKPENILFDENYYPLVCDIGLYFCLPKLFTKAMENDIGTIIYMPPEMLNENKYSPSVDVYSFSILAYEILTEKVPFLEQGQNISPKELIQKITSGVRPTFTDNIPLKMQELMSLCWSENELERPSFDQIVSQLISDTSFAPDGVDFELVNNYLEKIDHPKIQIKKDLPQFIDQDKSLLLAKLQMNVTPDSFKEKINLLNSISVEGFVCDVCFNYSGDCFAFSDNKHVFILSTNNCEFITSFAIPNPQNDRDFAVRTIRFSSDSKYLAFNGPENNVLVYSVYNHQIICDLKNQHSTKLSQVLFSNDSSKLYSSSFDNCLCIWDLNSMSLLIKRLLKTKKVGIFYNNQDMITSLSLLNDKKSVLVAFMSGEVHIYDQMLSEKIYSFNANEQHMYNVSVSRFGNLISSSSSNKTTNILELKQDGSAELKKKLVGHNDIVLSACFSINEKICFTAGKDETIKVWNYENGECLCTIQAHNNTIFKVEHHPSQKIFVSSSGDGSVCLWSYNF